MIIKYEWRTRRGARHCPLTTWWRGWFLLGIVPIYISCQSREYVK